MQAHDRGPSIPRAPRGGKLIELHRIDLRPRVARCIPVQAQTVHAETKRGRGVTVDGLRLRGFARDGPRAAPKKRVDTPEVLN